MKKGRRCLYCIKFFECNIEDVKERCIEFELNPNRAEDFREFVETEVGRERIK